MFWQPKPLLARQHSGPASSRSRLPPQTHLTLVWCLLPGTSLSRWSRVVLLASPKVLSRWSRVSRPASSCLNQDKRRAPGPGPNQRLAVPRVPGQDKRHAGRLASIPGQFNQVPPQRRVFQVVWQQTASVHLVQDTPRHASRRVPPTMPAMHAAGQSALHGYLPATHALAQPRVTQRDTMPEQRRDAVRTAAPPSQVRMPRFDGYCFHVLSVPRPGKNTSLNACFVLWLVWRCPRRVTRALPVTVLHPNETPQRKANTPCL
jgi:hypothetical protein